MANRQVATKEYSWYGENRSAADDHDSITDGADTFRWRDACVAGSSAGDITEVDTSASRKRFTLPIEPTESLDTSRDYPPIITVDGQVDTDIDHLMEHPEEDVYIEEPPQDVPSRFPKPQIVRVIDGSLDDDIDNLMNHDGTMTHTLVDVPKNLNRGDLKEINSKKSSSSSKKEPTPMQSERAFNRISADDFMEEDNSASELVPYFERNNSSGPMPGISDADICPLKESIDQPFCSSPVMLGDIPKPTTRYEEMNLGEIPAVDSSLDDGIFKEQVIGTDPLVGVEVTPGIVKGKVIQLEAISGERSLSEEKSLCTKSAKECEDDKTSAVTECMNHISTDATHVVSDDSEEASILLDKLLQIMTKEELEARINKKRTNKNPKNGTEQSLSNSDENTQKNEVSNRSNLSEDPQTSNTQMHDAIGTLKQALNSMEKEMKTPGDSESQKTLMVTALRVAGDSMTAAAKMADALSILVKSNQNNGHIIQQSSSPCQSNVKITTTPHSIQDMSHLSRLRSVHGEKKKKQNKSNVPEKLIMVGDHLQANKIVESQQPGDFLNSKTIQSVENDTEENERNSRERKRRKNKEQMLKHPIKDEAENMTAEEAEHTRSKSKSRYRDDHERREKESSHHKRSKTPKDKRKKTSQRKVPKDRLEAELNNVKAHQRHREKSLSRESKLNHHSLYAVGEERFEAAEDQYHDQWSLPEQDAARQRKGYFDQVARRLQTFSPPRHYEPPSENKEIIRVKLVGSCVDPHVRDSDYDSIEFNGNARMSDSTLVHYGDEQSD